ncbi:predicted protein [Sclerotinia sclerotiorum 1980 UF-70]|uniref:Uncharacterized protein n=1 Tax=Sclerotinia sclerotiorum (strain ATCC 18683 / 1980 / Ss-1) TaxID=665079 RepID=A7EIB4_SCLS1|nr:predicted protein [Sclerotinia sclerotiorum 1980 UF-70]EDO02580.1 predicted protein [Sclerotinia sclerotiorum 1980 UF-70]
MNTHHNLRASNFDITAHEFRRVAWTSGLKSCDVQQNHFRETSVQDSSCMEAMNLVFKAAIIFLFQCSAYRKPYGEMGFSTPRVFSKKGQALPLRMPMFVGPVEELEFNCIGFKTGTWRCSNTRPELPQSLGVLELALHPTKAP